MTFDLHCHIRGGSVDSIISLRKYITLLQEQGFDGMAITDHTTYRGCKIWDKIKNEPQFKNFTVIKGIEYDTLDAGHFLVFLPDGVLPKIMKLRGMKLEKLIKFVHSLGGILGPAHPFGVRSSSLMFMSALKKNPELIHEFDFIETFNTCELKEANEKAKQLAEKYKILGIGGSDSHNEKYVGMGFTKFDTKISSNNDLINAIKSRELIVAGGEERPDKGMTFKLHWSGVYAFKAYNTTLSYLFAFLINYNLMYNYSSII